jgi:hypothetical protein
MGNGIKFFVCMLASMVVLTIPGCNSGGSPPPPTTYTIGGTVSGLSGTGLVLQDNGGNNLLVSTNGAFTFSTPIASGGAYAISVLTQPSSPAQSCAVTNGSGTASANVVSVEVTCTTITYTIGGIVSGLSGTGLVLQDDSTDNLPVITDGSFTFATPIASGGAYAVTVLTQPTGPVQSCVVTNGSGTADADITSVQVACTTVTPGHNEWTWVSGSDTVNQAGSYGTLGTAAPTNAPWSRTRGMRWTDKSGNLWLFGGYLLDDTEEETEDINDLWKYSGTEWTWMGGLNVPGSTGVYGTQGTPSPTNVPGARDSGATWTDANGNLWLFGGIYSFQFLHVTWCLAPILYNDLWEYSAGQWTWMGGSDLGNQTGVYGTLGTASPGNLPGARAGAVTWTDLSGDFWLFGGAGLDSTETYVSFNDLWKYSAGEWTWVSGSNLANQAGSYGTQGTAAPGNVPGARSHAVSWTDLSGNLWLFGGDGFDSTGTGGVLNDLWEYSGGQWTWVSGSLSADQKGTYGTEGVAAPGSMPGARAGAVGWTDGAGNYWLFGGGGFDSTGTSGFLNDLWEFSAGEWIWMGGSNLAGQTGTYGTQGVAAPENIPGARDSAVSWTDGAGNFWLFGGESAGFFNDLWEYQQ